MTTLPTADAVQPGYALPDLPSSEGLRKPAGRFPSCRYTFHSQSEGSVTTLEPEYLQAHRLICGLGGLLKGATDENGQLKSAGLMVGIKLDLEAEVHLTARIRGDIVIGLY